MHIFKTKYTPKSKRPSLKKDKQGKKNKRYVPMASTAPKRLKAVIPTPNLVHRVLNKMAFGVSSDDIAHIESLPGANNQAKVLAYIDEQLDYTHIDDSYTDSLLTASNGFTTLNKTRQQLYQEHIRRPDEAPIDWVDHIRPGRETSAATFIRALYSKRQLFEMMVDFWHNHFNVYLDTDGVPGIFVHYDRDVIRANAMGNFRNMAYAVTQSTSMMMYLGNALNHFEAPNENFARELLELHTLGAENYLGHMNHNDVPVDDEGRKVGYVERDVYYLARALTGWSYDGAHWSDDTGGHAPTGLFMFREDWHYDGISRVLGQYFEYSTEDPLSDFNAILDILAEHPGTAKFLARKMCRRFISDNPPQSIVNQVADVLHENWTASDQIQQAMEVLLKSDEFLNTWGEKIKRPFERSISAMRGIGFNYNFNPDQGDTNTHRWLFAESGGYPFDWTSPNGYPDVKAHWLGSSAQMMTWRYIQWFSQERDGENANVPFNDILNMTTAAFPNANDITPSSLVTFWYEHLCGVAPEDHTRDRLQYFMSLQNSDDNSDGNPGGINDSIDITDNGWPGYNQERLMALVGMICMTTEFGYR